MNDLISRQAAIDAMIKLQTEDIEAYGASIPEGFDGDRAATALKALPSAQPERKTGKWVKYDGDWFKTMFKCSECGAMIDINEKYRNFFCYHCGADMRGEQDG